MRERLANSVELLDAPLHDRAELEQSLDHVAEVNRWLGGTRAVLHALKSLLQPGDSATMLDLGTGSADIPLAIAHWAARRRITVTILATDVHPQMRAIAAQRTAAAPSITIAAADALALPFADRSFDIVLLSLTLHHFEDAQQLSALTEAARVARRVVLVNELERNWPNLLGAGLLARTRWRANRITRHDGPLSVRRGFRRRELISLARRANLRIVSLHRRFFFRLLLLLAAREHAAAGSVRQRHVTSGSEDV